MAKFCTKCGNELEEGVKFCPKCGNNIEGNNPNYQNTTINNNYNYYSTSGALVQNRNIVMAIILSFVTCGLYDIYWFITMTDDSNRLSNDNNTSGGMACLFTLITCGIYSFFWNYQMGKKLYEAGNKYNKPISDNSIVYLLLSLFGLSIVSYCLIQNDLNKFSQN